MDCCRLVVPLNRLTERITPAPANVRRMDGNRGIEMVARESHEVHKRREDWLRKKERILAG